MARQTVLSIKIFDGATAEEIASEAERIAKQVREGYNAGDTQPRGWWELKYKKESVEE